MLFKFIDQTLMPYSVKCLRYVTEKPYKKIGDCQSFGRCYGIYQLTVIRLSGVVESQTATYIVDCCRLNGYTSS